MNVNFMFKGVEVSQDVKDYAEQKAQMLSKYLSDKLQDARVDIEFSQDGKHSGQTNRVDMVVVAPALDMHTVGRGETMQAAIDMAKDDMARRLRRKKRKETSMLRKGGRMFKRVLRRSK